MQRDCRVLHSSAACWQSVHLWMRHLFTNLCKFVCEWLHSLLPPTRQPVKSPCEQNYSPKKPAISHPTRKNSIQSQSVVFIIYLFFWSQWGCHPVFTLVWLGHYRFLFCRFCVHQKEYEHVFKDLTSHFLPLSLPALSSHLVVQSSCIQILPSSVWDHAVRPDPRAPSYPKKVLPAYRHRV